MKTLSLAVALLFIARSGLASPVYPQTIETTLGISHLPVPGAGCRLCHSNDSGGAENVVTRFAKTMERFGLVAENPGSLINALHEDEQQGTDSDGDGVSDIDELIAGTDPSVPQASGDGGLGALPPEPPQLETGCTVEPGKHPTGAWLGAAALAGFSCRRFRRRTRTNR